MERFRFTPFWKLTNYGWLPEYFTQINKGCDEWHNKSFWYIIPLIGEFTYFPKKGYLKTKQEHVHGYNPVDGFMGTIYHDCDFCLEFVRFVKEYDSDSS